MTEIKICGLMREEDAGYLNGYLPELAGFIFAKDRRRYVSPEKAAKIRAALDSRIKTVGVFVNEQPDIIYSIAGSGIIDLIQLHGNENDDIITKVRQETGLPVIKAFSVKNASDIEKAEKSAADMILLDNGAGGTGEAFDITLLNAVERPFILAGGLSPDNISEIIRKYAPYGADVSSGVETDGKKDPGKIKRFIENARKENIK